LANPGPNGKRGIILTMRKLLRVLVVEDEPTNREVAEGILSSLGHEVIIAVNGQEALDTVTSDRGPFDIVLMDVLMPILDGFSATRRMRALPAMRDVPIVCVSAKSSGADAASGLAAGCDYYLQKPHRARQLLNVMEKVLKERGVLHEGDTIG
jgi:CheY-like chemotaxis protein